MLPSSFLLVMWLIFIGGAIFTLSENNVFYYKGIMWLVFAILIFYASSYYFEQKAYQKKTVNLISMPNIPWGLIKIFLLLSIIDVLYTMVNNNISLNVFSNFNTLQNVSQVMTVQRYSQLEDVTLIGQILGTFIYVAPLCSGYSIVYANTKNKKYLCLFCFIPAILMMLLTSAKLSMISSIMLFFTGYYVSYVNRYKKIFSINTNLLKKMILVACLLFFLLYISFVLRIGMNENNIFEIIVNKLSIYTFGHIQGFDVWFSKNMLYNTHLGFGSNTFLAISSRLGIQTKQQGIYDFITESCTNVYSPFRGLIEDFGPLLSLFLIAVLGFLCSYYFYKICSSKRENIFYQFVFSIILFSNVFFMVSPWVYTTYYITFFIFALFILFSYKINIKISF